MKAYETSENLQNISIEMQDITKQDKMKSMRNNTTNLHEINQETEMDAHNGTILDDYQTAASQKQKK